MIISTTGACSCLQGRPACTASLCSCLSSVHSRTGGLAGTPSSTHNGWWHAAAAAAISVAAAAATATACRLVRAWVCWLSAAGTLSSQAVPPSASTAARCQHRYACSTISTVATVGPAFLILATLGWNELRMACLWCFQQCALCHARHHVWCAVAYFCLLPHAFLLLQSVTAGHAD